MKRNDLTLLDIARIGLFLDDPYGDGIRLERVREPSDGRQLAMKVVYDGMSFCDGAIGDKIIRKEYEARVLDKKNWKRDDTLKSWIARNLK